MLKDYKGVKLVRNPNMIDIPVNVLQIDDRGMEEFNMIYDMVKSVCEDKIVRTKSGGISYSRNNFNPPMYDVRKSSLGVELTYLGIEGMYRWQFRSTKNNVEENVVFGRQAFNRVREALRKEGINLDDYKIDNGPEVKKEIEPYMIQCLGSRNYIYKGAYHIDANSSFWSQLCLKHPEFRPAIEPLYLERKVKPENKQILTNSIGFMQSLGCCNARWANLSKDAINGNNEFVRTILKNLEDQWYVPIGINTDGIWYCDPMDKGPYHDENEGTGLGQWKTDHKNCKIRFKSDGAYEFIEDGEYHAVIRGRTNYDAVKPRSEWEWGDIYRKEASVIQYDFNEYEGVFKV